MPRLDFVITNVLAALFIIINFMFFNMSMVNKFITMSIILIMMAVYLFMFILKPRRKESTNPSYYHLFMSVYIYLIAFSGVQVVFSSNENNMKLIATIALAAIWLGYVIYLFVKCHNRHTKLTW